MNLRPSHILNMLLGMALGAGAGYCVTFLLRPGTFQEIEKATGERGAGILIGAIVGAAGSVVFLLVRSVRNPNEEPSRNITSINGIGSTLIGKSDVKADGSYLTTEWFIVAFVPIFPICRYRVKPLGRKRYSIAEKYPPILGDSLKVYGRTIALGCCGLVLFLLLKKLLLT